MEVEVVRWLLGEEYGKRAVLARLVFYCAPFLKRLKISSMIWMPQTLLHDLEQLVGELGVGFGQLDKRSGDVLVFLYRREALCRYLMRARQQEILLALGYPEGTLEERIERFAARIRDRRKRGGFPEETGLFLGYPVEDVEGFVREGGKKELCSGYWQVYERPEEKKALFALYDQVKVWAVNEFLAGKEAVEICLSRQTHE